ncbi:hypothetical protein HYH03_006357 [Edaphochlamys debaryana]|uniref:Uncharacterized protein n=1 Tax=Edaphochlamys debaryana TaxID=47281 RepID=A0A835YD98_9CHLO|nr:hypothetical protein HYH03_006357 [Edaphochlamys debaryana]|eukprot:KAG2495409.1 hypothetical protein HYH03_006357 [Edaphochlamys debaryana]
MSKRVLALGGSPSMAENLLDDLYGFHVTECRTGRPGGGGAVAGAKRSHYYHLDLEVCGSLSADPSEADEAGALSEALLYTGGTADMWHAHALRMAARGPSSADHQKAARATGSHDDAGEKAAEGPCGSLSFEARFFPSRGGGYVGGEEVVCELLNSSWQYNSCRWRGAA